jgi:hypothetical protein
VLVDPAADPVTSACIHQHRGGLYVVMMRQRLPFVKDTNASCKQETPLSLPPTNSQAVSNRL